MSNSNLQSAKKAKNDEFYTRREDIENELSHYSEHFKGKVVYCNCDDPEWSEFVKFFKRNFRAWGLKKLIATHYEPDEKNYAYYLEYNEHQNDGMDDEPVIVPLQCNGDFRSDACVKLLEEADIVVTNPPFSLFREYVAQLMEHDKKFLIIGSKNAITYKEFFPLLKENKVWVGCTNVKEFFQPDGSIKKFGNIGWFTNLDIKKRHELLDLRGNYYDAEKYPTYDNYDAINVNKINDIPEDYDGIMGVPITFMDKYCPDQFEIVGLVNGKDDLVDIDTTKDYTSWHENKVGYGLTGAGGKKINGNPVLVGTPLKGCYFTNDKNNLTVYSTYARIFIRKKRI